MAARPSGVPSPSGRAPRGAPSDSEGLVRWMAQFPTNRELSYRLISATLPIMIKKWATSDPEEKVLCDGWRSSQLLRGDVFSTAAAWTNGAQHASSGPHALVTIEVLLHLPCRISRCCPGHGRADTASRHQQNARR